jgi:hypothetical protein
MPDGGIPGPQDLISDALKRNGNKDGSYHPWRGPSLYLFRRKASVRDPRLEKAELPTYVRERLANRSTVGCQSL